MADDKIIQQVELQGAEQVQKDFKATGDAGAQAFDQMGAAAEKTNFDKLAESIQQIVQAARQLTASAQQVSDSLNKQADATNKVADSSQKASTSVSSFGTNLRGLAIAAASTIGGMVAFKLSIDNIASALRDVQQVGKLADAAGIDRGEFQKLQFILEQLGLSTDEARAKIKEFADGADAANEKIARLSGGARALIEAARQTGVSFTSGAAGMDAFRNRLAQTAQTASGGLLDIQKLSDLLQKFQGETDPQKMVEFANALAQLTSNGKQLATVMGQLPQGGFGKVINIPQIRQAGAEIKTLDQAWAAFMKNVTSGNLTRVVDFLLGIESDSKRASEAVRVLGDDLGNNLIRKIEELKKQGISGNPLRAMIDDFIKMRLESQKAAQIIAEDFDRAMKRFQSATKASREEFALLFGPAATAGLNAITTAMRSSDGALRSFINFMAGTATGVVQGFIELLTGQSQRGSGSLENSVVEKSRTAVIEFGKAVKTVFGNIIEPAIAGAQRLFSELADIVSKVFGVNASPASIGLVAVIGAVLGPVNSLILAFAALFGQSEEGMAKLRTFFSGLGIDIDELKKQLLQLKDDFIAAFQGRNTDVQNKWVIDLTKSLKEFATSIPGIITETTAFLLLLGRLIGPANLVKGAVLGMSGALDIFLKAIGIVGLTIFAVLNTLKIFEIAIGAIAAVFGISGAAAAGWAIAIVAAAAIVIYNIDKVFIAAQKTAQFLNNMFGTNIRTEEILGAFAAISIGLLFLRGQITATIGLLTRFAAPLILLASIWLELKQTMDGTNKATAEHRAEMNKLIQEYLNLDKSAADYEEKAKAINERIIELNRKFREQGSAAKQAGSDTAEGAAEGASGVEKSGGVISDTVEGIKKQFKDLGTSAAQGIREGGPAAADAARNTVRPVVETFRDAGNQIVNEGRRVGEGFGKVIQIPQSNQTLIRDILKGINEDILKLRPNLDQQRLDDAFDQIKQKVSALNDELEKLPENMQLASGELDGELTGLITDLSSAGRKALDVIDQVSAKIQGSTTGLGGGKNFLTEQFGDPSMLTEMVAGADRLTQSLKPAVDAAGNVVSNASRIKDGMTAAGMTVSQLNEMIKSVNVNTDGAAAQAERLAQAGNSNGAFWQRVAESVRTINVEGGKIKPTIDQVNSAVSNVAPGVTKIGNAFTQASGKAEQIVDAVQQAPAAVEKATGDINKVVKSVQDTLKATNEQLKDFANVDDDDTKALLETWKSIAAEVLKALAAAKEFARQLTPQQQQPGTQGSAQPLFGQPQGRGINDFLPDAPPPINPIDDRRGEGFDPESMVEAARTAVAQIQELIRSAQGEILSLVKSGTGAIQEAFQGMTDGIAVTVGVIQDNVQNAQSVFEALGTSVQTALQNVQQMLIAALDPQPIAAFADAFAVMTSNVSANIDALIAKLQALIDKAREAASAVSGASGGSETQEGGGSGFAGGGRIYGRPGIDTNIIRATAGEFMMRVRAVRKYGLGFMRAVNAGRFELPGFDAGGMIGALQGGMSTGSRVSVNVASAGGGPNWDFIELSVPGFGVIPVAMKSTTARDVRAAAIRNRQTSISQTTR